ncbi:hypothetical protein EUZ85_19340 [Hahella sp. KA22]|uniref:hypothetical protein n=2 Tax=Gammaproteobacteria TaxID=1236 RepID=UPI000FDD2855|nr:hypothetical protein [Hahella sp. KA22]AZZ92760.1 hypothetical protein ENC22_16760 [Hahella sp. KA22]QAY56134.1 hypothetical protein EUZ85_19340 [Hahella sp. KA22]
MAWIIPDTATHQDRNGDVGVGSFSSAMSIVGSYSLALDADLTLTGPDFGAAPTLFNYADFNEGSDGNTVPAATGTNGFFSVIGAGVDAPKYINGGRVGALACRVYGEEAEGNQNYIASRFNTDFGGGITELYASAAFMFPDSGIPPQEGTTANAAYRYLGSGSSMKLIWANENNSTSESDVVFYSHVGASAITVDGNDIDVLMTAVQLGGGTPNTPPEWWVWDQWMLLTVWAKADPVNPATVDGTLILEISNPNGRWRYEKAIPIFKGAAAGDSAQWTHCRIPGWMSQPVNGFGTPDQTDVRMDTVYLASSPKRIVIADAANWEDVTEFCDCPFAAWGTDVTVKTKYTGTMSGPQYAHFMGDDDVSLYSTFVGVL